MARPIRVGVQLPEVEREVRWPEYMAMARAAETAGFDSVWVGDHLLYREDDRPERGPWEAWSLLAGLAVATTRVGLGPLVACAGFHAPAVLAKKAATVDEISGGRLILGLGAGWNEPDFRAFGLPFDNRVARFEESFEIVRRLLDGERVTFSGRFWSVDDCVLYPRPRRRPRLLVGSTGPRMLAATLPHVDAWNVWFDRFGNTPEGFAAASAEVSAAEERAGRAPGDVERSACVLVVVDPTAGERRPDPDVRPVEGPAGRIAGRLREFADAGAGEAILVLDPITERSIAAMAPVIAELGR